LRPALRAAVRPQFVREPGELVTVLTSSAHSSPVFTIRCQACPGYVRVECEDLGGPWHSPRPDDRPHGLDIIEALAGPGNWGTETTGDGSRIVWVQLAW